MPGPWSDRTELVRRVVVVPPAGTFFYAAGMLAQPSAKDHVRLDFADPDPDLVKAFTISGRRQISEETLRAIEGHRGIAFLHFDLDVAAQRERMIRFSSIMRQCGGLAVKIDSAGVAHEWDRWFELLGNGGAFDLYCAFVTLVADLDQFYSCGMHHFGLSECAVPHGLGPVDAAELMNRFNVWRIDEKPHLESGHTFSVAESTPRYRMRLGEDRRHEAGHLFHNPHGVWSLEPA